MSAIPAGPDRWAAYRAAQAARRDQATAAWAAANTVDWQALATRHTTAEKARQIWATAKPAKRPSRQARPVPAPGRQFAASLRISAVTDAGLAETATKLLALIAAQASAARGYVWSGATKAGLARQLQVAPCTIRRSLRQLEERGYVQVLVMIDATGRTTGLEIHLLPPAISPAPAGQGGGVHRCLPSKDKDKTYTVIPAWHWRTLCRSRWIQRQPAHGIAT